MIAKIEPARAVFLPVTPEIAQRYREFTIAENDRNADYSAANLYLWDQTYHQEVAFVGERAIVRYADSGVGYPDNRENSPNEKSGCRYLYPIGKGPITPAVSAILQNNPTDVLRFIGVTPKGLTAFEAEFPGRYTAVETPDYEDYLYTATSLVTLSGKKLHAKRNHIHAFSAAHNWQVTPLSPAEFSACRQILSEWENGHLDDTVCEEHKAIERALIPDIFQRLALSGALLIADGVPAAFCIGEKIASDTFCVHFEKAGRDFTDAYPVINREFAAMVCAGDPDILYINREEDMGLANLRAAKRAYHPVGMVQKFTVQLYCGKKNAYTCISERNVL